jgi:cytochrome c-type biogenesis protein
MVASTSAGLALLGGVLTVLSPCILPILPILVGRSLQSHRYGPIALVIGLTSGFAVAGSLLGITASWFTGLTNGLRSGAIVLLLFLGLLAVFPNWSDRLFRYLPVGRLREPKRIGLIGEFWLGTQLGLLWTPCAGPVLASILVLAAVDHQVLGAFGLLVIYGIGAALPMLAIAYGGRTLSQRLLKLRAHSQTLRRIGGVMIVVTAIAILVGWDVQVQLWLAPLFPPLSL